jgi:hypothetical protein
MMSKNFRNPKTNLKIELEVYLEIEKFQNQNQRPFFNSKS